MNNEFYVPMRMVENPEATMPNGSIVPISLPDGCIGVLYCFEKCEDGEVYFGKDVPFAVGTRSKEDKEVGRE